MHPDVEAYNAAQGPVARAMCEILASDSVRLLFWSGQSFEGGGLEPQGKFKAAEVRFTAPDRIDAERVQRWLRESKSIQWDYKNIVKRKGRLERLE